MMTHIEDNNRPGGWLIVLSCLIDKGCHWCASERLGTMKIPGRNKNDMAI